MYREQERWQKRESGYAQQSGDAWGIGQYVPKGEVMPIDKPARKRIAGTGTGTLSLNGVEVGKVTGLKIDGVVIYDEAHEPLSGDVEMAKLSPRQRKRAVRERRQREKLEHELEDVVQALETAEREAHYEGDGWGGF
jgi:hypothetical protein